MLINLVMEQLAARYSVPNVEVGRVSCFGILFVLLTSLLFVCQFLLLVVGLVRYPLTQFQNVGGNVLF